MLQNSQWVLQSAQIKANQRTPEYFVIGSPHPFRIKLEKVYVQTSLQSKTS